MSNEPMLSEVRLPDAPAGLEPALPREGFVNSIGMKFVLIPAGRFVMGSPETEEGNALWERPQHEVTLTESFYMGIHLVTQAQYKKVSGNNPSHFRPSRGGGLEHPVEVVSWDDAVDFCAQLSKKEGKPYRLPTEAEWEYACRAGTTTATAFGDSLLYGQATFNGNHHPYGKCPEKTTPVGSYPPNAWGLYDMHGNVWEWCGDWYGAYPDGAATDPTGPTSGDCRVLRGGSWIFCGHYCSSAFRSGCAPGFRNFSTGFRVVAVRA